LLAGLGRGKIFHELAWVDFSGKSMSDDAATISVDCPGCGKRFKVAAQHAGRKGKCKACGTGVVIPAPPRVEEEDIYDITEDVKPAARAVAAIPVDDAEPAAQPAARPAMRAAQPKKSGAAKSQPARGPVLSYSGATPRQVKSAAKPGEFDPFDHFEGNRFKNLYLPLILIFGTAAFNVVAEVYLKHNASTGIATASARMVAKLAVEIPCMLIACVLAVKLLDAAFGPLGPAILKLSSIALAPDAVMDLVVLVAFLFGRASGNGISMAVDVGVGLIFGWIVSLGFYFWLFMYFFDLEFGDVWKLALFIWFVRMLLAWLITMVFLSWLFH
jgi:rRNA maturation protein Nop10